MKKYILTIALALVIISLEAQEKPSFISLNAGASIPVGKFHSMELPDGAFAITGGNASLEGAWFFKPWIGIGANAGISFHPVDVGALGFEKINEDPFMEDVYIRSNPYRTISGYAGLYFHFPLAGKLSAAAKLLGGMIYAKTPYQLYKAEYYLIGEKWFEITSAGDYEGSFLAGAGFRYDINESLGFSLNSEFTYNQADFDFTTSTGSRTDIKVISFVNLNLGVIWKISHKS
jgi:hypothetical protein